MDKKLYLLAEFDNDTQIELREFEKIIIENNLDGKQTKDIPYHITLCSYPLDHKNYLEKLIEGIGEDKIFEEINITFSSFGLFGLDVLFLNPLMNKKALGNS